MQVLLSTGCSAPMAQQPKIEGTVRSVSRKDIEQATALVEQSMRHEFHRVFPIKRVEVKNHNEIDFIYDTADSECWVSIRRVHGLWTPPPENVWVTG
jgi:hypothetical protein